MATLMTTPAVRATKKVAKRHEETRPESGKRTSRSAPTTVKGGKARAKEPGPGLSKERIVAAAVEQIDRNGVMGFSLRDVARSLGVYPAAVYWHVATRDDLLAHVVEFTMADVAPDPEDMQWQDWFRELFRRCRDVMRKHPNVAQLVAGQLVANASLSPKMIDRILLVLVRAGCKEGRIVEAYNAVIAAMVGFSSLEFASVPTEDPAGWAERLQTKAHEIRALEYPMLARHLPAMANRAFIVRWQNGTTAPMDSSFELYVDVFIGGLQQFLANEQRP